MTNVTFEKKQFGDFFNNKIESLIISLSKSYASLRENAAFLEDIYMTSKQVADYVNYLDSLVALEAFEERLLLIENRCEDFKSQYNILDANITSVYKEIVSLELGDARAPALHDVVAINNKNIENLRTEIINFLSEEENLSNNIIIPNRG